MKKNAFKDKTAAELLEEVAKMKKAQAESRFSRIGKTTTSLKEYRTQKKTIAQLLTLLNTK